jgi:hypothetical protein
VSMRFSLPSGTNNDVENLVKEYGKLQQCAESGAPRK